MTRRHLLLKTTATSASLAAILFFGLFTGSRHLHADDSDSQESRIQQGFAIAPVPLKLAGKNRALVGLGSYIVNTVGCDDCHNGGPGGASGYLPNGNPYLLRPPLGPYGGRKVINTATYLGGGRDFGAFPAEPFPHIVSRNLTPDKTGRPEGGHTFAEFREIIRTGVDMDQLHPTCTNGPNGHCIPAPFDGSRLQVMPWPGFQDMTDHDLEAIYEYLSAVPCVTGPPAPDPRHNDCQ